MMRIILNLRKIINWLEKKSWQLIMLIRIYEKDSLNFVISYKNFFKFDYLL